MTAGNGNSARTPAADSNYKFTLLKPDSKPLFTSYISYKAWIRKNLPKQDFVYRIPGATLYLRVTLASQEPNYPATGYRCLTQIFTHILLIWMII